MSKSFERFERIYRAYAAAVLGDRPPETVNTGDPLPAVFAAVPDTNTQEIAAALRWAMHKCLPKADALYQWWQRRRDPGDPEASR
jgi:hypothetical protein